ncbi:MAG: protein translocase subunit SecD, partial [Deltaproteobacteria bacterium]
MKLFTFKNAIIFCVVLAAIVFLLPTFFNCWPHKKINMGLDLQGGMHLVLEVQNIKAVEAEVERTIQEIKKQLRKEGVKHLGISRSNDNSILAKFQDNENKSGFETLLSKSFENLITQKPQTDNNIVTYRLSLPETETDNIKKMATDQALETIRNRIDEFGVSEPDIRIQGD